MWMLGSPYALCSCHGWRVDSISSGNQMLEKTFSPTDGIVHCRKMSTVLIYECHAEELKLWAQVLESASHEFETWLSSFLIWGP